LHGIKEKEINDENNIIKWKYMPIDNWKNVTEEWPTSRKCWKIMMKMMKEQL